MKEKVIKRLDQLIIFLEPWLQLVNSHMVDFFTQNVYKTVIPVTIQQEIEFIGFERTFQLLFNDIPTQNSQTEHKYLSDFISKCKKHSLLQSSEDVSLNLKDFENSLMQMGCTELSGLHLDVFMNSKKSHEVEIMSEIASAISQISKTDHLVDIGDGKGYLSSALALKNGLKVLGIDSSIVNTKGAAKRNLKLNKILKNISKDSNVFNGNKLYKQSTKYVTEDVNLMQLTKENFPNDVIKNISLIGLHTCGNLSPTCLKIFINNPEIISICNVGCCYHLLTESVNNPGFPISKYLQDNSYKLGRNARMISSQSLDRILDKKELPSSMLFYRSLLQILLMEQAPELADKQVGRIKQKLTPTSFVDYTKLAFKKFGSEIEIPEQKLLEFYNSYKSEESKLQIFYLIRAYIAPVIEAIIILDRLLYLKENGIKNSFLVQLFNPVISPRCYGIVAVK